MNPEVSGVRLIVAAYVMNRPTYAVMLFAVLTAGCELVAGIQDKYLATTDGGALGTNPSETGVTQGDDSTDAGVARPGSNDATDPATGEADALDATTSAPPLTDAADAYVAVQDAPAPDAGGGSGERTAPDAGTTDPSAPCSGQPTFLFCDDFDTENTVAQGWTWMIDTNDGGTASFDTAAYTSAPRSLQIIAPSPPSSTVNQVFGLDLGTLTSQVRLAFDVRLDMASLASLPNTAIAQILGARQGTGMEIDYLFRTNQSPAIEAYVSPDGGAPIIIPLPSPPLQTWTRLVVVYDVSAGITVYEDGVQIAANASATAGVPNDTKVQMGMIYEVGAGSGTLQMEDGQHRRTRTLRRVIRDP